MSEQEMVNEEELETLDAESEEQKEDTAIKDSFDSGVARDDHEDDIKLAMIGAGATFKNVTRLYNQFMVEEGFSLSKEDKASHVTQALDGKSFATEDDYDVAIESLVSEDKSINERSAGGLLRAYAKKNGLDVYKKPKSEGAGRSGFASEFYDWMIATPGSTKEDAINYINNKNNPKVSENVVRNESHYMNIWSCVHAVAVKGGIATA
jgi:hypothetical protein